MALPTTTARQQPQRTENRAPHVLYIGDRAALDFLPARRRLAAEAARGLCSFTDVDDSTSALNALIRQGHDQLDPADVLILTQLRPGELNDSQVNELRRHAPLAAMVVLCGAWCEGEARSGHPVPGIAHVAWHQFAARWVRHRTAWQQGRPMEWALPATWREEERLLHLQTSLEASTQELSEVTIVLAESTQQGDDWLASAAQAQGWRLVHSLQLCDPPPASAIGLWQTDELDSVRLDQLRGFVDHVRPFPVIALSGFPRPEDDQRIRSVGAHSLIAKPLLVEDLVAEVAWVLEGSERGSETKP